MKRIPPKEMAGKIIELLRKQNPDPSYVKKMFQYIREGLDLKGGTVQSKQLPELMTEDELKRFYNAVWYGCNQSHTIMLKLLLFTGIRNEELASITINNVDIDSMRILISQEKRDAGRYVLFPPYFKDEFAQYINIQKERKAIYLFESNRKSRFTTRSVREIVKKYAKKAGISKKIHPHLFRHQILTYLMSKGIVDEKIKLISGHKNIENLGIYHDLNLSDVEKEYWSAMKDFPIH